MPVITISMENSPGVIAEQPAHELPPEAWSFGKNVRFQKTHVTSRLADAAVSSNADATNYGSAKYILPVNDFPEYYWICASNTAVSVLLLDGYTAIWPVLTRAAGAYTATELDKWTGGVIGGIPFLSNPNDEPQAWTPVSTSQLLQNFSAVSDWVSTHRCRAMRSFKQFLVAVDITKGSTRYPRMVKWSAAADPNTLPGIWDITDKTKEAGETELAETDDACVDSLTLGNLNIIYKEFSTYSMQFIGGAFIFRFQKLPFAHGILSPACAVEIPGGLHFVVTKDDMIVHNGVTSKSVADYKMRTTFFNDLDSTQVDMVSVVADHNRKEVIIFYPGGFSPSKANTKYTWNWETGAWGNESNSAGIFSAAYGVYQTLGGPVNLSKRAVIASKDGNPQFFYELIRLDDPDAGLTSAYTVTLQRDGLSLVGQDRQGKLRSDPAARKFVRSIWPKIQAASGKTIKVSMGSQEVLNGTITWEGPYTFDPETQTRLDFSVSGKYISIKFETDETGTWWRLYGYELDLEVIGKE